VLHRGLHTGVILRTADIPPDTWRQHNNFPSAQFLEAGWGDSQGYRYPWTTGIVLRAMFDSKESVLLVHAFSGSPTNEYAGVAKEVIEVQLSKTGFARLCKYIQDTYALDPQGRPIPLPTVYPEENFFRANGHYSMLNNCNNWTARALRAAGCPICPRCCVLPRTVMAKTRRFGTVIWPSKSTQWSNCEENPSTQYANEPTAYRVRLEQHLDQDQRR